MRIASWRWPRAIVAAAAALELLTVVAGCELVAGLTSDLPDSAASTVADGDGIDGGGSLRDSTIPWTDARPDRDSAPSDSGASDACAADLSRDPRNCGSCGHVCESLNCMSARCTPTVFVAGLPSVDAIAADAQGVYFATQGTLNERLVASASGLVTLASSVGVYSVAADTTNVYFTGPLLGMDRVAFVPKTGGSVVTMTTQPSASAIAVDDVNVYYTGVTPHDVLGYVPKSSTSGVVPTVLVDAGALSNCLILAARGGSVYFVNLAQLYALPRTGGLPRNLQATSHQPDLGSVIAVNDTGIAWSGGKPGGAYAMHMAFVDHSFVELSDGGPSLAVGIDDQAAYALVGDPAGTGEGSIVKVPLDGSARSLVATGLVRPTKMATAADAIYVVAQDPNNNSAVAILRIAK